MPIFRIGSSSSMTDRRAETPFIRISIACSANPASTSGLPANTTRRIPTGTRTRPDRLILQDDYDLPPDLVEQIKLLPFVEDAREIQIGEVPLPEVDLSATA